MRFFSVVTKPSEGKWPFDYNSALGKNSNFKATTLHKVDSERALLSLLLALLYKADPDLLVGHDIANFDLPTLLTRLSILKVENWSRLGRLRRANKMENFGVSQAAHHLKTRIFINHVIFSEQILSSQDCCERSSCL